MCDTDATRTVERIGSSFADSLAFVVLEVVAKVNF